MAATPAAGPVAGDHIGRNGHPMDWHRHIRRTVAICTALAVLAPAAVLPVVDARADTARPGVEAQHEPGRCHLAHDHLACVQFAGSAPLARDPGPLDGFHPPVVHRLRSLPEARAASRSPSLLHRPRAPPALV